MSEIKEFYTNKTVLLTGATGMIGKLILAKFMRLGNLKEIVIFVREKKGLSMEQRIEQIFKGFLFEKMESYDPKFKSKLKLIFADLEIENLGISNKDLEYIKNNVEIIIHGAATVRFDELLKKSLIMNIGGTKFMLDLAKETKHLKSFVHISTAFSQSYQRNLEECFYKTPFDPKKLLKMTKNINDDTLNALTPLIMHPWPNSYVFTKAHSEDLIRQYQNELPIAIIRPSIGKIENLIR
jgi:alcohol-forming fatty acyl-CoA reductase